MKKIVSIVAGAALLALSGNAFAGQPFQLSSNQMDHVTAGGAAVANAAAMAWGDAFADTMSQTATNLQLVTPKIAIGMAQSQSLAGSLLFQAAAASHSDTAASL